MPTALYLDAIIDTIAFMPPDEQDPPRKFYGLKPKEFERLNKVRGEPAQPDLRPDPGIVHTEKERIDVRDILHVAAHGAPVLGNNSPANRENEVHAVLRTNFEAERAAGLFHVEPGPDRKRRRRLRNFWIALIVVDSFLGWFAWMVGPGAAIPFVCAIGGLGMFTAVLIWNTFFLRTD